MLCRWSNFAILYPASNGPVAYARGTTTVNGTKARAGTGPTKNKAVFIWETPTVHSLGHDQCRYYFCISYFARVKPIIYEKSNLVLKFKSISII